MTDHANAKLRELREMVSVMPGFAPDLYACTGEEASCVFRGDVLDLIDAMLTETSDHARQLPSG